MSANKLQLHLHLSPLVPKASFPEFAPLLVHACRVLPYTPLLTIVPRILASSAFVTWMPDDCDSSHECQSLKRPFAGARVLRVFTNVIKLRRLSWYLFPVVGVLTNHLT